MPEAPKRLSLEEFAKKNPIRTGLPCWLCHIPERAEVERAFASGVAQSVIRRWLAEDCGYGEIATTNKVGSHFTKNRHHERTS